MSVETKATPENSPRAAPFRLNREQHAKLMAGTAPRGLEPRGEPLILPEPVYPRHPGRREQERSGLAYHTTCGARAVRCWVMPYLKSRIFPRQFRPILAYLFTDYACNLDCHYCWANDSAVQGMSDDTARRSIDWLHSVDCRVLALMGGEPLVRPDFVHKVVDYGTQKGFFVYLPTNGRLMTPDVVDRLGDAGLATLNLAVDCIKPKPGLPKALELIRPQFDYLVRMQRRYGYMIVFNINICRNNLDDVKELTEIAYANGISSDYHINEEPLMEHSAFRHLDRNGTFLGKEDFPAVDELLDYLIDKNRHGYVMVNSRKHLSDMKDFMRGTVHPWLCRAGQSTLIIRTDGSLAPCFAMDSVRHDWGTAEDPKFEMAQLDEMKASCNTHCLSTCNYIAGHYYSGWRWFWWALKQLAHGYQGIRADAETRP